MSKTKIFGVVLFSLVLLFTFSLAQAATDAEELQPAAPGEATKIGDLGHYFDEYSSYLQLDTALHSSETMHLPDVHIGGQGVGGVTFFNGTIVNETTDPETGADQPVTFGDKVRIDDYIYRNDPGAVDKMPVLIGDGLSPALDAANSLGEAERRWQYLYVSDNIYGDDLINENNLSVTNDPTANYVLSYAGDNRFTWTSNTLNALSCFNGQIVVYDSATTSWVCSDLGDAISDAIDGGDTIISSSSTTIETHHHDGSSSTTINAHVVDGTTTLIPVCNTGTYVAANSITINLESGEAFSDTNYTVTATYETATTPTAAMQSRSPIIVDKISGSRFIIYTCLGDASYVNWHAFGD